MSLLSHLLEAARIIQKAAFPLCLQPPFSRSSTSMSIPAGDTLVNPSAVAYEGLRFLRLPASSSLSLTPPQEPSCASPRFHSHCPQGSSDLPKPLPYLSSHFAAAPGRYRYRHQSSVAVEQSSVAVEQTSPNSAHKNSGDDPLSLTVPAAGWAEPELWSDSGWCQDR